VRSRLGGFLLDGREVAALKVGGVEMVVVGGGCGLVD